MSVIFVNIIVTKTRGVHIKNVKVKWFMLKIKHLLKINKFPIWINWIKWFMKIKTSICPVSDSFLFLLIVNIELLILIIVVLVRVYIIIVLNQETGMGVCILYVLYYVKYSNINLNIFKMNFEIIPNYLSIAILN